MKKTVLALLLVWVLCLPCFVGCDADSDKEPEAPTAQQTEGKPEKPNGEGKTTDAPASSEGETVGETETLAASESETVGETETLAASDSEKVSETETLAASESEAVGEKETLASSETETAKETEITTESETESDSEEEIIENGISFKTLTIDGTKVYGKLPNETTIFSFKNEINVIGNASYGVYRDISGEQEIKSKMADLAPGDNTFYIIEYLDGEMVEFYVVKIRRAPMYTVTFDTQGGSVIESQGIEEGGYISVPEDPVKEGYNFVGWSIDLTKPIEGDLTVIAQWNTTPYKVEHYLENADGSYELKESEILSGGSGSSVTPSVKEYAGFIAPEEQTVIILDDGSLVVRYEYTRNSYTISFVTNGGEEMNSILLKYGEKLPQPTRANYTFGGWFIDAQLENEVSETPSGNVTIYAYWVEENKPTDFRYSGTGSISITKYLGDDNSVRIPLYIGGMPVKIIANSVFNGCSSLMSIVIPDGVTNIGVSAFKNCSSLASIVIPDGVTNIGNSAFIGCSSLASIVIPDSVTNIEDYAFKNCSSLMSIVIPDSVTSIGEYAFCNCVSLSSVEISDDVTSIGSWAFDGCGSLKDIKIGDGVTNIGEYAFSDCTNIESATIPAFAISHIPTQKIKTLIITSGDSIGEEAFSGHTSLMCVVISDSITSIGPSAFSFCTSLTSVEIPDGVMNIGEGAFYKCTELTSITLPFIGSSKEATGIEAHFGYIFGYSVSSSSSSDCHIYYDGGYYKYNIPESLTSVKIGNGVTSIGSSAFYNCSGLTSVVIPDSVTSIGDYSFYNCSGLASVTIGDGVMSIGSSAFNKCSSLMSVVIPDSVTSIGNYAFKNCSSLTSVTIGDSVTSIGYMAFCDCTRLTSVTIPNSVTGIGDCAFSGCGSLASVVIPDSVTSIGASAFCNCSSLTSVTIPDSVKSIGRNAFSSCSGLTSINIPDSVTSIGDQAFSHCSSLMSVTIGVGVTSMGEGAFYDCTRLTSIKYNGTQAEWNAITKGPLWDSSTGSYTITYNYTGK